MDDPAPPPSAAEATPCQAAEALLQVSYTITRDEWRELLGRIDDDGYVYARPELQVRPSGTTGNSTVVDSVGYSTFEDVVDYQLCVPRDGSCVEVTVGAFPPYTYAILWNGQPLELGQEFYYWGNHSITSTEVGEYCTPECQTGEALFELRQWTAGDFFDAYRVADDGGAKVLGCDSSPYDCNSTSFQLYTDKACLPLEGCHRFVIGGQFQWPSWFATDLGRYPSFQVHYGGELLMEKDSWLIETVRFGEGCQPECAEEESRMEVLTARATSCRLYPLLDLDWQLTLHNDTESEVVESGTIGCESTLYRGVLCVPQNGCATFDISVPSDNGTSAVVQLSMDDVVYRRTRWYAFNELNQTTKLGYCSLDSLCEDSASLFELELQTVAEREPGVMMYGEISWILDYSDPNRRNPWDASGEYIGPLLDSRTYFGSGYEINSTYRTLECVPAEECAMDFNMTAKDGIKQYRVMRNGVELGRETLDAEYDGYPQIEVTRFGESCASSSGLSGGAVAGIVIGCVASMTLLGYWLYKKRTAPKAEEETEEAGTAPKAEEEKVPTGEEDTAPKAKEGKVPTEEASGGGV